MIDAKYRSRRELAMQAFRSNHLAVVSLYLFILLIVISIFAEFFAPYGPQTRNKAYPDGAPMGYHLSFRGGGPSLRIWARENARDSVTLERIVKVSETEEWKIKLFGRGESYSLLGFIETDIHLFTFEEGYLHMFGTDKLGRDILSRTIYSFRTSLSIGIFSVITAFILGVILGGLSGYIRGKFDSVLMRVVEFIQSIPTLPLWLTVAASVPRDWSAAQTYLVMTLILALIGWTSLARRVRSRIIAMHGEEYILAARLAGAPPRSVFFSHMLPAFSGYLIVDLTLAFSTIVIAETSLSFLGLGLREPIVSLGVLLLPAQSIAALILTPWYLIPGMFVVFFVLLMNFIGDGVRDAIDPQSY